MYLPVTPLDDVTSTPSALPLRNRLTVSWADPFCFSASEQRHNLLCDTFLQSIPFTESFSRQARQTVQHKTNDHKSRTSCLSLQSRADTHTQNCKHKQQSPTCTKHRLTPCKKDTIPIRSLRPWLLAWRVLRR